MPCSLVTEDMGHRRVPSIKNEEWPSPCHDLFLIASLQSFSFPCLCRLSSPLLSYIYGGHNFFNCYFSFKCSTPRQPSWSTHVCERRLIQYSTFLPIRSTVNRIVNINTQNHNCQHFIRLASPLSTSCIRRCVLFR